MAIDSTQNDRNGATFSCSVRQVFQTSIRCKGASMITSTCINSPKVNTKMIATDTLISERVDTQLSVDKSVAFISPFTASEPILLYR